MTEGIRRVLSGGLAVSTSAHSDSVPYTCPHCGSQGTLPAIHAGRPVRCPRCQQVGPGSGQVPAIAQPAIPAPAGGGSFSAAVGAFLQALAWCVCFFVTMRILLRFDSNLSYEDSAIRAAATAGSAAVHILATYVMCRAASEIFSRPGPIWRVFQKPPGGPGTT
jgi:hypothetical protein